MGRLEEVLVEKRNLRYPDQVLGRNPQGKPVAFKGEIEELMGKFVPVRITECRPYALIGEQEGDAW